MVRARTHNKLPALRGGDSTVPKNAAEMHLSPFASTFLMVTFPVKRSNGGWILRQLSPCLWVLQACGRVLHDML